jgi:RNA polymerase sigma-70 factor (ECF subfamily)
MSKLAHDDEEVLIALSQRGDVEAFNELVVRYQQTMFSAIFRMLGDYETAADVTQDAFLAAFRGLRTYRGGSSFRAWLMRIGTNMAYDHWRRVQRRPTESLEALTKTDEPHAPALLEALASSGVGGDPEESLLTQELLALLQDALQHLPPDQRIAVVLRDVEGFSYEEVAETTQVTLGTVRSRISRGRARLRDYLTRHKELLPRDYRLKSKDES